MKRPLFFLAIAFVSGICFGRGLCPDGFTIFLLALTGFFIIFHQYMKEKTRLFSLLLVCSLLVFLFASFYSRASMAKAGKERALLESCKGSVEVTGTVSSLVQTEDKMQCILTDAKVITSHGILTPGSLLIYPLIEEDGRAAERSAAYTPGRLIRLKGEISSLDPERNPGNFDAQTFYEARGILCAVKNADLIESIAGRTPVDGCRSLFHAIRNRMNRTYQRALPGEEGGLLSSMTLGSRDLLTEDMKELFQKAGLIHLMAVSGTHIQVVASRLYKKMKKKGAGLLLSGLVAGFAAVFYGALCGSSLSTERAVGMFLLLIFGDFLGRAYDSLTGLGLLAVFLLLKHPAAIEDSGFLFSFSAVLLMVLFQSPLQTAYQAYCKDRFERKYRRKVGERFLLSLPEQALSKFLSALSFQIATLPLMAALFYEIPVYVFLLNLLVLPLFPILLMMGLLFGLLICFLPLDFLLLPCHLILYLYEWTADLSQSLPGSRLIVGKPPLALILIYYLILFGLMRLIQRKIDIPKVFGLIALSLLLIVRRPAASHIDMLDLGQGDGILIHDKSGADLMVDGGSSDVGRVGTYRILPYLKAEGIRHLDSWVISHTDEDHICGMEEVIEADYPIGQIIIAKGMPRDQNWEEIEKLAEEHGIPVRKVTPGDRLVFGESSLTFLYPLSKEAGSPENKNDLCLSFWLENGDFTGMFTGDLAMEGEDMIMNTDLFQELLNRDRDHKLSCLKVGHHGSATSSGSDWLDVLSPETAIISAGQNNRYGHPSKETIERLEERQIPWHLTAREGMIRVGMEEGRRKVRVSSYSRTASGLRRPGGG